MLVLLSGNLFIFLFSEGQIVTLLNQGLEISIFILRVILTLAPKFGRLEMPSMCLTSFIPNSSRTSYTTALD